MNTQLFAAGPPSSVWTPPAEVTNAAYEWLGIVMYGALACSILATITFGAMLIADKHRGEPVSATAPHMRALRLALGALVIASAGSLAAFFMS